MNLIPGQSTNFFGEYELYWSNIIQWKIHTKVQLIGTCRIYWSTLLCIDILINYFYKLVVWIHISYETDVNTTTNKSNKQWFLGGHLLPILSSLVSWISPSELNLSKSSSLGYISAPLPVTKYISIKIVPETSYLALAVYIFDRFLRQNLQTDKPTWRALIRSTWVELSRRYLYSIFWRNNTGLLFLSCSLDSKKDFYIFG